MDKGGEACERSDSIHVACGFKLIGGRVTRNAARLLCCRLNNFSKSNGTSLLKLPWLSLSFHPGPPLIIAGYITVAFL